MTSHLLDDAVILIEKLHAVGWRPLLLLEYPQKEVKLLLPKDQVLGKNAQTCVTNIKEIFKIIVEGNTNQPTQTTSHDSEEVTLHLESIPNPSTGEQDSTAATGMVQGAVATDGPECELCLSPTGQATICMDQGAVTKADPGHDINQPPTGPGLKLFSFISVLHILVRCPLAANL
ncbi:hypothetical protein UPYG_G00205540 [Umbra pygmaea]|uniref:Uncharacterized protein n=1 Tax=Umbra pygmaea TaxID=75934 RepID=A0ABD0WNU9_UMBPY